MTVERFSMELNVILCNHAEVQNNMLYLSGGGIDRTFVPQGSSPPWAVNVALGLTLGVPWTQTNQQHTLSVTLEDADGQPVMVPVEMDSSEPFRADLVYNVGRPPTLLAGEAQNVSFAINLPGFPMPSLGQYFFVISVDGSELQRLPYSIVSQSGMTMGQG